MTAKELREQAGKLAKDIRTMADLAEERAKDGKSFTAEEEERWKNINADYDAVLKRAETQERAEKVTASMIERAAGNEPPPGRDDFDGAEQRRRESQNADRDRAAAEITDETRSLAVQAWFRNQTGEDLSDEHRQACRALRFSPNARRLTIPLLNTAHFRALQRKFRSVHPNMAMESLEDFGIARRDLSAFAGATGGFLVPPENFLRQLEVNMLWFGGMRQVAETMTTSTGERMGWPTGDDTSNVGEQLGETASVGASVDPTFAKVFWDAYKFSSKLIRVPHELIEDAAVNLVEVLGAMLGERIGRITNTKYTTGTGASTPKGVITAAATKAAASATAIAGDDIIALQHSVDPAYRMGAGFMCHDGILEALRKLKDGQGRYLWQSGLQDGVPDRLLGATLTINNDMDSTIASGKKTLLWGQLSRYKIRRVGALRMYRLQERFRDNDEEGFIALIREDGNLLDAGTKPVKVLLH